MLDGSLAHAFAKKLYADLLMRSGYNRLIRPVRHVSEKVIVKIGIVFSQLIDVVSHVVFGGGLVMAVY